MAVAAAGSKLRTQGVVDSAEGWLVVAGTALCTFTVFGVTYSFGTFFTAMAADFEAGKGATALLSG